MNNDTAGAGWSELIALEGKIRLESWKVWTPILNIWAQSTQKLLKVAYSMVKFLIFENFTFCTISASYFASYPISRFGVNSYSVALEFSTKTFSDATKWSSIYSYWLWSNTSLFILSANPDFKWPLSSKFIKLSWNLLCQSFQIKHWKFGKLCNHQDSNYRANFYSPKSIFWCAAAASVIWIFCTRTRSRSAATLSLRPQLWQMYLFWMGIWSRWNIMQKCQNFTDLPVFLYQS